MISIKKGRVYMNNSKYLPVGINIGGHYEIIDVLGDDDFEILYLVRDTQRRGSFFVLKELFLESFSSRDNQLVFTIPEAEGVFKKRKQEIILEIDIYKKNNPRDEVKIYGYIEENNTIYTIMEFTNNFSLENYLHFHPRDEIILPPLDEITKKKGENSFLFLKILIVSLLIVLGLVFYAKKMIKEDREKPKDKPNVVVSQTQIHHPALKSREDDYKKLESRMNIIEPSKELKPNKDVEIKDDSFMDSEAEELPSQNSIIKNETQKKELKTTIIEEINNPSTQEHKNISLDNKIETSSTDSNTLETKIQKELKDTFNRDTIKNFLDRFIASSATGSIDDIVSQYDYHVDRYFSLRNISQSAIKRDKRRYNRRWINRNFQIESFKILKKYKRDGTDYCDIRTVTKWRVESNHGKRASGKSRGLMTIKNTDNGFKVKSIYTTR